MPDPRFSDLHIDEFYADASKIIVNLFRVFPRPVTLFAEDICGADTPDEYGVHSNRYQACFAAMLWLGEEGYLRYQDLIKSDAIDQAVLTGRCFTALLTPLPGRTPGNQQPAPEDAPDSTGGGAAANPASVQAQHSSLVFHLADAVDSRSSIRISEVFQVLLRQMSAP